MIVSAIATADTPEGCHQDNKTLLTGSSDPWLASTMATPSYDVVYSLSTHPTVCRHTVVSAALVVPRFVTGSSAGKRCLACLFSHHVLAVCCCCLLRLDYCVVPVVSTGV